MLNAVGFSGWLLSSYYCYISWKCTFFFYLIWFFFCLFIYFVLYLILLNSHQSFSFIAEEHNTACSNRMADARLTNSLLTVEEMCLAQVRMLESLAFWSLQLNSAVLLCTLPWILLYVWPLRAKWMQPYVHTWAYLYTYHQCYKIKTEDVCFRIFL